MSDVSGASQLLGYSAAGLDLLTGLFGYFAGQEAAAIAESRGRMLRQEAEIEAQRYREQATSFKASQKGAYIKAGVRLTGSPLAVLDETERVAQETLSAIRAAGRAREGEYRVQGLVQRTAGRRALLEGVNSALPNIGYATTGKKEFLRGGYDG